MTLSTPSGASTAFSRDCSMAWTVSLLRAESWIRKARAPDRSVLTKERFCSSSRERSSMDTRKLLPWEMFTRWGWISLRVVNR